MPPMGAIAPLQNTEQPARGDRPRGDPFSMTVIRSGVSPVPGESLMTLRVHHWKNLTRSIAMLTLVSMAGAGCGDSTEDGSPGQPQDAGIDRVDVTAVDALTVDRATDDARITDADGGCACTRDDAGAAFIPLECFCANGCPTYDAAMSMCQPVQFPEDHRIDTYADCNLVVIRVGHPIGLGGSAYVYDATTRELVGGSSSGEFPSLACGDAQVFGYRAGTFPPATCARTSSAERCVDGGDGG
jgi:hypothetical protein